MTKKENEHREALETLQRLLKPGDTIFTKLIHVSKSGMTRILDVFVIRGNELLRITFSAAILAASRYNRRHEGAEMGGCGMDMGFALVYNLSHVLFPAGFGCLGKEERTFCPSCDHSNGDRDYTVHGSCTLCEKPDCKQENPTFQAQHWHTDGGYALRQRWF